MNDLDREAQPDGLGGNAPWRSLPGAVLSAVLPDVVDAEPLAGGAVNDVWRLTLADGSRLVLKGSARAPSDLFPLEAEGLRALREHGGLRVPRVIEAGSSHVLMESLGALPDAGAFWEAAGRAVAGLHTVRGDRFGWHSDGWLGRLRQENAWSDDGHEFFAERRILRYFREPGVQRALETADLVGLERLCDRLPLLLPDAPSVLNHGDLYQGNLVADSDGVPAFIDPAVCWMWAESDLSMMYCNDPPPDCFFHAYQDISPLSDGWQERMVLLHVRELLSVIAHFGAVADCVAKVREAIRTFS